MTPSHWYKKKMQTARREAHRFRGFAHHAKSITLMDWLIDWLDAKTHSGSDLELPSIMLFWPEIWMSRLWGKVSVGGSDPPQPWVRTWGKPEAVGLEQSECNWSHLERKNYFCWHISSSTWQRPVCYGRILEVHALFVGCCPSFMWSIFHTIAVFLTR